MASLRKYSLTPDELLVIDQQLPTFKKLRDELAALGATMTVQVSKQGKIICDDVLEVRAKPARRKHHVA